MTHTVTITRLGQMGDGLADGPVIVPGALPGEVVEGVITNGRMEERRIVTPSPDRVRPPCPHAAACGGCMVQHGSDALVAGWKRDLVVQALRAQGIEARIADVITSPAASRRRAGFAGRRTKKGALIGFHGRRSHTLVPVPDCLVITKSLRDLQPHLEAMTLAGGSRKGEITWQATDMPNGPDISATGGKPLDLPLREALVAIGAAAGLSRLTWNGEPVAAWAPPQITLGLSRVTLPPGAFLQATQHGEAALTRIVTDAVAGAARIADLFCGCGTFTLPLARQSDVLAVEGAAEQIGALDAACRQTPGLHPVKTLTRDLFRRPLVADELAGLDAVVIDPPRAGAAAQMAALAQSEVPVIVSVSCAPSTFARDAATLIAGGYRIGAVTVVDQFRWSPHVEMVAAFHR